MKGDVLKLFQISSKAERNIIGLMSGTSLDGLDIAYCIINGVGINTKIELKYFETIPYTDEVKEKIKKVFAKQNVDFQYLTLLNAWLGNYHASLINQFLDKFDIDKAEVDLIASHGQTVFHAPSQLHKMADFPNATLQIVDGDHIAVNTGIITISDFRQKHIAAGGEGAPLAVYGDFMIFSKYGENRIMLNIGGIANFTFLPKSNNPENVFVTDTGPGNTLLDAFTRIYYPNQSYDKDSEHSLKGKVCRKLLLELLNHEFFSQAVPKTTGPELFNINYVRSAQERSDSINLSANDLLATLTRFSAETIAQAIQNTTDSSEKYLIYLSGGGMHNPLLVKWLKDLLPNCEIHNSNILGINGDAKEAILFAILANEMIAGEPVYFGNRKAVPSVSFGKISLPS